MKAHELRKIRFATIEGLQRRDLGLACDIWLEDVCRAPWATREAMRLAAHLVRYMLTPRPELATLMSIDQHMQLGRDEVKLALKYLWMFHAVEAFTIERDEIRVALRLTELQRLRILETQHRLDVLVDQRSLQPTPATERWLPDQAANVEPLTEVATKTNAAA
jgi:hypothetical protein